MQAPDLWQSATRAKKTAASKAQRRIDAAVECRDRAFTVFVDAVRKGQQSASLKKGDPKTIARVLTTVVDGYLFQLLEEHVDVALSPEARTRQLEQLVKMAVYGMVVPPRA